MFVECSPGMRKLWTRRDTAPDLTDVAAGDRVLASIRTTHPSGDSFYLQVRKMRQEHTSNIKIKSYILSQRITYTTCPLAGPDHGNWLWRRTVPAPNSRAVRTVMTAGLASPFQPMSHEPHREDYTINTVDTVFRCARTVTHAKVFVTKILHLWSYGLLTAGFTCVTPQAGTARLAWRARLCRSASRPHEPGRRPPPQFPPPHGVPVILR